MKLIPAALFIIAVFIVGLLFRQGRMSSKKGLLIPIAVMLLLLVFLLKLIGKIAVLIAAISAALFFALLKKR